MPRQQRSTWIALICFAFLEHSVNGIRGGAITIHDSLDNWETTNNAFNLKSRKLAHDILGEKVSKTDSPSSMPSVSARPSTSPAPSARPSMMASLHPSQSPSLMPTSAPTAIPTGTPSDLPSTIPTILPSLEPSIQPSVVPTASPAPSSAPTSSIEVIVNENEDGTVEYITDCIAKMPQDATDVTDQLIEFQYKLLVQEGANQKEAVDYIESRLHTNVTAEFIDCPYKNLTGLPFEVRSVNSFPKDEVLKACDEDDEDSAPCFLVDAAFTVEIFSYISTRRLQQAQTVDLRVAQVFGPFLDSFFSSEWLRGLNSEVVGVDFEGFTNAETGLPTYGGNGDLNEGESGTSGIEGEVTSDNDINKGPVVGGILAVSAAAIILVVIVAIAYRKRREESIDVEKLKERGVIRPEESLAKAMDSLDDDSFISNDYSFTENPPQRAYIIPDDASTAAGSAILREYSNKYSPNENTTFRPAFISTGSTTEASVAPSNTSRAYNSSDTVDL